MNKIPNPWIPAFIARNSKLGGVDNLSHEKTTELKNGFPHPLKNTSQEDLFLKKKIKVIKGRISWGKNNISFEKSQFPVEFLSRESLQPTMNPDQNPVTLGIPWWASG